MGTAASVPGEWSVSSKSKSSKSSKEIEASPLERSLHKSKSFENFKNIFHINSPKISAKVLANSDMNNESNLSVSASLLAVPYYETDLQQEYRIMKKISHGGRSIVYKAVTVDSSHKRVAIKEVELKKLSKKETQDLTLEIHILSQLSHPSIVKFISVYNYCGKVSMVMECLRGGELLDAICEREYYTEGDARRIMLQITSAVDYMHSKNVIHRDIKPENILLETKSIYSNVKLVDFGFAILSTDPISKHSKYMCGTPGYMSPEILLEGHYSPSGDVWALGIMLYILLSGAMPFDGKNEARIISGKYPLPSYLFNNVSPLAKDLISKALVVDPSDRYSAYELLNHPWMLLPVSIPGPEDVTSSTTVQQAKVSTVKSRPVLKHQGSSDMNIDRNIHEILDADVGIINARSRQSSPKNSDIRGHFEFPNHHDDNDITSNLTEFRRFATELKHSPSNNLNIQQENKTENMTPRTEDMSTRTIVPDVPQLKYSPVLSALSSPSGVNLQMQGSGRSTARKGSYLPMMPRIVDENESELSVVQSRDSNDGVVVPIQSNVLSTNVTPKINKVVTFSEFDIRGFDGSERSLSVTNTTISVLTAASSIASITIGEGKQSLSNTGQDIEKLMAYEGF